MWPARFFFICANTFTARVQLPQAASTQRRSTTPLAPSGEMLSWSAHATTRHAAEALRSLPSASQLTDMTSQGMLTWLGFRCREVCTIMSKSEGMPADGMRARMAQLAYGVQIGAMRASEARTLITEQPEYLRCGFGSSCDPREPGLICVEKPWNSQLSLDTHGPDWAKATSLKHYLASEHAATLTSAGEVRLCHQLDYATSGVLMVAASSEDAARVASCFRRGSARKLYAALVFGHPRWETTVWEQRIAKRRGGEFGMQVRRSGKTARTNVVLGARGLLRLGPAHQQAQSAR